MATSYRWDRTLSLPRNADYRNSTLLDKDIKPPIKPHEDPTNAKKYLQTLQELGSPSRPYAYESTFRNSLREPTIGEETIKTGSHRSRRLSGGRRQNSINKNTVPVNNSNTNTTNNNINSKTERLRSFNNNTSVDNNPTTSLKSSVSLRQTTKTIVDNNRSKKTNSIMSNGSTASIRTLNTNISGLNSVNSKQESNLRSVYSENVPPPSQTSSSPASSNNSKNEPINKTVTGALKRRKHIVLLGLDGSGKTTLLMRMKFGAFVGTAPTIGFNHEKVWAGGFRWSAWDVGGGERQRPLWVMYSRATDGIIFVIDASSHADRLEEARMELVRVIKMSKSTSHQLDVPPPPVLVLANFQDRSTALGPSELAQYLGLSDPWASGVMWAVAPVCGLSGEGVDHSLTTLRTLIDGRKKEKPKKEAKRWRW